MVSTDFFWLDFCNVVDSGIPAGSCSDFSADPADGGLLLSLRCSDDGVDLLVFLLSLPGFIPELDDGSAPI